MTTLGVMDGLAALLEDLEWPAVTNEEVLQEMTENALKRFAIPYEREAEIKIGGRIDFLVDGQIGLELKIKGSVTEVSRQAQRYLEDERLKGLLLLTTRRLHMSTQTVGGKPFRVVVVGGAFG